MHKTGILKSKIVTMNEVKIGNGGAGITGFVQYLCNEFITSNKVNCENLYSKAPDSNLYPCEKD